MLRFMGPWAYYKPDDGLGGDGAAPADPKDDPIAAQFAAAEGDDGLDDADPLRSDPRGVVDPGATADDDVWAGFGEDIRELAATKGWKGPEDMARSYSEMERTHGQRSQRESEIMREVQGLRDEMARRSEQQAPAAPPPPPGAEGPLPFSLSLEDADRLMEVADGDPGKAIAIYNDQVVVPSLRSIIEGVVHDLREEFSGQLNGAVQPIGSMLAKTHWRDEAIALQRQYGEDFAAVAPGVEQMMKEDPGLRQRQDGMRIAAEVLIARRMREREVTRRKAEEGETLIGGRRDGGNVPEQDEFAAIREGIRAATTTVQDGLTG